MQTQTFTDTLVPIECYRHDCGVTFGMTQTAYNHRREDHKSFYCTNGHSQHYTGKTEAERLREQLGYVRESEEFYRNEAAHQRRVASAQKGQRTRVLNLIAKGVCPVGGCRRNFTNVKDHMATEHPDFHTHEVMA